jgi:alkylhydroperoxidase family enzyme
MACLLLAFLATAGVLAQAGTPPRVAPVPEAQWDEAQRALAAEFAPGGMSNAVATLLHHPALARIVLTHERYLASESTLPPRHRALLALRTAWLTRSSYFWAHRAAAARQGVLTAEDIRRVAQGPDARGWEPFEVALLRAADELHVDSFVSDPTWRTLSTQYDVRQLIDVIDTAGAYTMYGGMLASLGVPLEPGLAEPLPTDVPYVVGATRANVRLQGREPRIGPAEQPQAAGRGGRGPVANVFITFRHNPTADRVRGAINTFVNGQLAIAPRHRELLLMRIGVLCRSEYEYAAHHRIGRGLGKTDADVARIVAGPDAAGGDPLETALLRATDELFEQDRVSDGTWTALAAALDTRQLFDVLIAVGGYRSTSMLINSAGVQLDANMADFRFPPALR